MSANIEVEVLANIRPTEGDIIRKGTEDVTLSQEAYEHFFDLGAVKRKAKGSAGGGDS